MIDAPRLRTPVIYACPAVVLFAAGLSLADRNPNALVWPVALIILGLVFGGAAMFSFLQWWFYDRTSQDIERRKAESITPLSVALNAAAKLTAEQAATVQTAEFRAAIGMASGTDQPIYFVMTRTGNVPIDFANEFLHACGMVELRAVRTYSEGTPARTYAQAMTDWCVAMGLATPAGGNRPAQWIDDQSKARAFKLLDLDFEIKA